jgi:myosin heavy subunit
MQQRLAEGDTVSEISRSSTYQEIVQDAYDTYQQVSGAYNNLANADKNLTNAQDILNQTIKETGGASGSSKTEIEQLDKALQDYLKTLEHELFLLQQQEGTEEQQIAILRKMQEAVHEQAEKYRAMGLKENDEHLMALSEQWWSYESDIEDVYDKIKKAQEDANKEALDKLTKQVNQYKDTLKEQNDDINEQFENRIDLLKEQADLEDKMWQEKIDKAKAEHDATEKQNTLLDLQNKLIQAQLELTNASKERTVKMLQGTQWEWVSDPKQIADLTQAVKDAQDSLTKEQAEQEYEDSIANLEAMQKEAAESYAKQIEVLQDQLDVINKKYQDTIDYLDDKLQSAEDMLENAAESIISSMAQVEQAFRAYAQSIQNMSNSASTGSGKNIKLTGTINDATAKSLMRQYSQEWLSADEATREYLHQQSMDLAAGRGWTYDNASGVWIDENGYPINLSDTSSGTGSNVSYEWDPNTNTFQVKEYHSGTVGAGGVTFDPRQEEFVKLLKGEPVLSKDMVLNGIKLMDSLSALTSSSIINNNQQSSADNSTNFSGNFTFNTQALDVNSFKRIAMSLPVSH